MAQWITLKVSPSVMIVCVCLCVLGVGAEKHFDAVLPPLGD